MLRISILMVGALIWACESGSSSDTDEQAGGQGSGATSGTSQTGDAGAATAAGSENQAAAGSGAMGAVGGEPSGGHAAGGASPQGDAGEPSSSAGTSSSGGPAVSELDECKYSPDECQDKPGKPHYWECDMDPNVSPGEGCEPAAVDAVTQWCCPDPFCSPYAGAKSLCEGLFPEQPNGLICATGTPGLADCKQPNPISLAQVYCCP